MIWKWRNNGKSRTNSIVFKIEFEINLKFYFVYYNTKNNIFNLNIIFGYIIEVKKISILSKYVLLIGKDIKLFTNVVNEVW